MGHEHNRGCATVDHIRDSIEGGVNSLRVVVNQKGNLVIKLGGMVTWVEVTLQALSIGTLKSTRMRTRLEATSTAATPSLNIVIAGCGVKDGE